MRYRVLFLLIFILVVVILLPKRLDRNEIRVLIDRIPNTLDSRNFPDQTARNLIPLIDELHYSLEPEGSLEDFRLLPLDHKSPPLHFLVVKDEISRALQLLSGRADVLYNTLSLSKTNYIQKRNYQILEAPGYNLSFLGFQLERAPLSRLNVRKAIQLALPIRDWIHYKLFDWVEADSETHLDPDWAEANRILDHEQLPIGADGTRFHLRYLTTPVREGLETATLVKDALAKIFIQVEITSVETSLFFQRLKKGDFDLFSSRIFRKLPHESLQDYLAAGAVKNYFRYTGPLDQANSELPFVHLYNWKHAVVLSNRIAPVQETLALDNSFRFLVNLKLK